MVDISKFLSARMRHEAPGFYTEQDDSPWYVVTPDHCDRIGEDFRNRDDARRLVCWLAGDPLPEGWRLECHGSGDLSYDVIIPGQPRACIWARTARKLFPARAAELAVQS